VPCVSRKFRIWTAEATFCVAKKLIFESLLGNSALEGDECYLLK
jgi:hypothetical protein